MVSSDPNNTTERARMRARMEEFFSKFDTSCNGRSTIDSFRQHLDRFFGDFLRGQLIIKKPRVVRYGTSRSYGIECDGREVLITAHLVLNQGPLYITPGRLGISVSREQSGQLDFSCDDYPQILEDFWPGFQMTSQHLFGDPSLRREFYRVINEAFGPRWAECQQRLIQEVLRIDQNIRQIVQDYITKYSVKERKALQKKLSALLGKTQGLIDADPKAIFEFYKLCSDDIKKFAGHVKRNPNDVDVVELEDIVEAQNLARVHKVMTA